MKRHGRDAYWLGPLAGVGCPDQTHQIQRTCCRHTLRARVTFRHFADLFPDATGQRHPVLRGRYLQDRVEVRSIPISSYACPRLARPPQKIWPTYAPCGIDRH